MEDLRFRIGDNWEERLKEFYEILGNLALYDKPLEDEKKTNLIRTLLKHFSPLAMISHKMNFEELLVTATTELSPFDA